MKTQALLKNPKPVKTKLPSKAPPKTPSKTPSAVPTNVPKNVPAKALIKTPIKPALKPQSKPAATKTTPRMDETQAVKALAGLAQTQRLRTFRALVVAGSAGLTPGALALQLDLAPSSLSFHLKELAHASLVQSQASGRNLIYRAEFGQMQSLLNYLSEHCCAGQSCAVDVRQICVASDALTNPKLSKKTETNTETKTKAQVDASSAKKSAAKPIPKLKPKPKPKSATAPILTPVPKSNRKNKTTAA